MAAVIFNYRSSYAKEGESLILSDIIAEIDEKYPNGLTFASKVRKADILHKRIYRELKYENFLSFSLVVDQPEYPLTVEKTSIFQVDVHDIKCGKYNRYMHRKTTDITQKYSKYHYFTSDPSVGTWIGLYPTPTTNEDTITIHYYEVPATLDPNSPSATPMLYENYHMMLVYGVCKEIAENYRDTDEANGFAVQYNALESELKGLQKDSDVWTVRNEMGW